MRLPACLPVLLLVGTVLLPVLAGLAGTLLPAFGHLPALGAAGWSLDPWRQLLATPGLGTALRLTLTSGFGATALSLFSVALFCAAFHDRPLFRRVQLWLAPLLATPHLAMGVGFLALAAPSGLLARLLAPLLGLDRPPDLATVNDPWGLALLLGLALKEAPWLLLMSLAALNQTPAARLMATARLLGQPAPLAWLKVVFPLVYRQIRLPVHAVLAYSLGTVEMALLLGPGNPPPLAVLPVRWFLDRDLAMTFPAAAAAILLLALTLAAMALWEGVAALAGRAGRHWAGSGATSGAIAVRLGALLLPVLLLLAVGSLGAVLLWSVAGPWRFPDLWPRRLDLGTWAAQREGLLALAGATLRVALPATLLALALAGAALEAVARHGRAAWPWLLGLSYLPLLLPQTGFLFGLQVLLLQLGLDGGLPAVLWAHLVFVLPHVLLVLAAPWAALDPRLARSAAALGAGPLRVLCTVKLPVLLRPLLAAAAVGVAVSVGQYLATLFAGGGRFATLTTEALALSSGGDRRVLGVFATLQAAIPLACYALVLLLPRWVWRRRAGLRAV
ncbi:ABC transporter permease subunit [Roseomonas sp. E05]|uniref:ABC transporter permease n=1 Tax=Roseomonas sp. E05 TaxID=3046310 RepID=UPI0024B94D49|nr:ABC transporter permease subunit [Roseomonas sp. E05]MDJ0389912.1 ABC transporter permease subunit [Roseomonas sp. E05]